MNKKYPDKTKDKKERHESVRKEITAPAAESIMFIRLFARQYRPGTMTC